MFPCLDMHNCRNNNRCKFAKIHNITFYFLFTFDKTILQLSCDNTYNLGCVDSCAMVTLPIVFPTDGHYTLYFSGTNNVKITVSGVSGEPILLDATLLNANSIYTFYIQNTSGVRQLFEIGEVEYDCFKIKIDAYFSIDATEDITPTQPCTLMCQETYDPMHESKDIFDYNNLRVKAVADGTTITGDGTAGNPFVAIGGGGGAVDSVNGQTGVVVLDTSDISEVTNKKYVTDAQLTVIVNTSGTNTGDNAANTTSNSYADGKVSDTAYNATSWDAVTGIAPSKNAVRDKIEAMDTAIALNTAKVTNATHTGEVTGATALTVDKTAITNKTAVTLDGADYVLFSDTSDSGNLKKGLISDIGFDDGDFCLVASFKSLYNY